MAYLYAKFATWRALVHATRSPPKLIAITAGFSAAFGALAYATQSLTDRYSAANEDAVRKHLKKDREAARYATHSKNALEVVLADAAGRPPPEHKHPMKMPQVHWHPGALKRAASDAAPGDARTHLREDVSNAKLSSDAPKPTDTKS